MPQILLYPDGIIVFCSKCGEVCLTKEQITVFYDEKNKLAGCCPVCKGIPRSIYPLKTDPLDDI